MTVTRRQILGGAAALAVGRGLFAPGSAKAQAPSRVLKFNPASDLPVIDPIWTTGYVVRNHGYLIYDTLYANDDAFRIRPQMAEGHEIAADGRMWNIKLRNGLKFHNGEPVRAADCVASIRRWAARDGLGQLLMDATDELAAADDKTIRFRLKRPFPLIDATLGKLSAPVPFMMPEHVAKTDPMTQITDSMGSGPFRFLPDEWQRGSFAAYRRFEGYVPRNEPASRMAGGKVAHVDRIEWLIIPDRGTAAQALLRGEIDWCETPPFEFLPTLGANKDIVVSAIDPLGFPAIMRFNHLQPPFSNVKVRRAVLAAVDQKPYMEAAVGEAKYYQICKGFMSCGTPYATGAGSEAMVGDLARAKAMLAESGYAGEKVVLLVAVDIPTLKAFGLVTEELFKKLGIAVEVSATDAATFLQRRTTQEPVEKGGWSIFFTTASAAEYLNPASHLGLRADGKAAWVGWPTDWNLESLRAAWLAAPNEAERREVSKRIEEEAFAFVPYVPLGQFMSPTAYRANLVDVLPAGAPLGWQLRKT